VYIYTFSPTQTKALNDMNFIELMDETSGNDDSHSATFVYIISENYFKEKNVDKDGRHNDDQLLAYLIHRLDNVVHDNYSLLYFHRFVFFFFLLL
jgi:hypothetical protein